MKKIGLIILLILSLSCASLKIPSPRGDEMGILMCQLYPHVKYYYINYVKNKDQYCFEIENTETGEILTKYTSHYYPFDYSDFLVFYNIPQGDYKINKITVLLDYWAWKETAHPDNDTDSLKDITNKVEIYNTATYDDPLNFTIVRKAVQLIGSIYSDENRVSNVSELKALETDAVIFLSRLKVHTKWEGIQLIIGDETRSLEL